MKDETDKALVLAHYEKELNEWRIKIKAATNSLTKLERELLDNRERAIKILQRAENK